MYVRYGVKEVLKIYGCACVLSIVFILIGCLTESPNVMAIGVPIALFLAILVSMFYRDPPRRVVANDKVLLAPADGTVRDIEEMELNGVKMTRIGIFLSVFSVHINRAPYDLTVEKTLYKEGKFFDARSNNAVKENESNLLTARAVYNNKTYLMAIKQVSGALARRIVCTPKPGEIIKQGQKYGMIKLGSRTELYFPVDSPFKVAVKIGDTSRAGKTIFAKVLE